MAGLPSGSHQSAAPPAPICSGQVMSPSASAISLRSISGPSAIERALPADGRITIGRAANCDLCLLDGTVSREHAALNWSGDQGILIDLKSSRGTLLNGVRLEAHVPTPVGIGDLLTVGPWTFRVHRSGDRTISLQTIDDTAASSGVTVARLPSTLAHADPQEARLQLLIECIGNLNAASDEPSLARAAVAAALKGTGFRRAAMLRVDSGDTIEVLASLRRDTRSDDPFVFSRSLVREAARGHVVALSAPDIAALERADGRSVADLGIQTALCLPVSLGGAVAAVLYLDSRRGERASDPANTAYCEAVARACGMAMANFKRAELERRQTVLNRELAAAREAQRVLVPPDTGAMGPVRYAVRMRPGLFVAGDLFDVFPLSHGRVGVFIGDVSGHGLGPALIMAMTQSQVHAQLSIHGDPARAMEEVNRYVAAHVTDGRFVSLWLGVISPDGQVRYVDAGHGHWRVLRSTGAVDSPPADRAIPVGIDPFRSFAAHDMRLHDGDQLLLFSDGIVEQRGIAGGAGAVAPGETAAEEEFGIERVLAAARGLPSHEPVAAIAALLEVFTGGRALSDDATVAVVTLEPRAPGACRMDPAESSGGR